MNLIMNESCRVSLHVKLDMEEVSRLLSPAQSKALFTGIGEVQAAVSRSLSVESHLSPTPDSEVTK